jgi:chromosome segregation ATPase
MAKQGRPKKINMMQVHLPKEAQSPERPTKKMARRGRPPKIVLQWKKEREDYIAHFKKQAEEIRGLTKTCDALEMEWRQSDGKLKKTTKELEEVKKTAEDRFLSGQMLAKQLVQAEGRITELLEDIRFLENDRALLRGLIIDLMKRD